ncbi:P2X purinoceptor 4 [Hypsibius exemplaris]|uniref:P2X purinoceptor 4 n=1 Tax=Hypsibius exemplaris TaxID=2072580 RepID=A0A9X6NF44_HYPEX|nr:P2X purinoceptor 4 [Hypsibius exemplaris]
MTEIMIDIIESFAQLRRRFAEKFVRYGKAFLFQYETPRVVTMRSRRIGLTYRIVQLALFVYLIGYVFIYSKSYQRFDYADGSVVSKVRGILQGSDQTNRTQIWDSNDFVVPAQESNAFFVATNIVFTKNQYQGNCPEDKHVGSRKVQCRKDSDCEKGSLVLYGNGIRTGRCVLSTSTCEVHTWCPKEMGKAPRVPTLSGYDSVSVLVKNHVVFRKFGVKRRNILDNFSENYLTTCRYHPQNDRLCPVFALRDLVTFAGESLEEMAVKGGIIGFNIDWDCDLDYGEENCLPHYSFRRLDNRGDKVASGWNFRHAFYYYDFDGFNRRDLVKYWGIRFVFLVSGRAGMFYPVNFILHVGSSVGLFSCASVICEFILAIAYRSDMLATAKFVNLEKLKKSRRSSSINFGETADSKTGHPGDCPCFRYCGHYSSRRESLGSITSSPLPAVPDHLDISWITPSPTVESSNIPLTHINRNTEWVYL